MTTILNCSAYACDYAYIVARYVDGDWWFYGAWNEAERAHHTAMAVDGHVFKTNDSNIKMKIR